MCASERECVCVRVCVCVCVREREHRTRQFCIFIPTPFTLYSINIVFYLSDLCGESMSAGVLLLLLSERAREVDTPPIGYA